MIKDPRLIGVYLICVCGRPRPNRLIALDRAARWWWLAPAGVGGCRPGRGVVDLRCGRRGRGADIEPRAERGVGREVRGVEHREGEQGAQLFLDDIGVQDLPSRSSVFTNACHIFAVTSGRRRSCAVSSRRRTRHAGSVLRPRRPWSSRITRCRTAVTVSLARRMMWKRSATSTASGSPRGPLWRRRRTGQWRRG